MYSWLLLLHSFHFLLSLETMTLKFKSCMIFVWRRMEREKKHSKNTNFMGSFVVKKKKKERVKGGEQKRERRGGDENERSCWGCCCNAGKFVHTHSNVHFMCTLCVDMRNLLALKEDFKGSNIWIISSGNLSSILPSLSCLNYNQTVIFIHLEVFHRGFKMFYATLLLTCSLFDLRYWHFILIKSNHFQKIYSFMDSCTSTTCEPPPQTSDSLTDHADIILNYYHQIFEVCFRKLFTIPVKFHFFS